MAVFSFAHLFRFKTIYSDEPFQVLEKCPNFDDVYFYLITSWWLGNFLIAQHRQVRCGKTFAYEEKVATKACAGMKSPNSLFSRQIGYSGWRERSPYATSWKRETTRPLIPFKKTKRDPYSTYLSFLAYTGMLPNDTGKSR